MAALDFSQGINLGRAFKSGRDKNKLDALAQGQERQKALFQDVRNVKTRLQGGDVNGALRVLDERINLINQVNGDPSDTVEVRSMTPIYKAQCTALSEAQRITGRDIYLYRPEGVNIERAISGRLGLEIIQETKGDIVIQGKNYITELLRGVQQK